MQDIHRISPCNLPRRVEWMKRNYFTPNFAIKDSTIFNRPYSTSPRSSTTITYQPDIINTSAGKLRQNPTSTTSGSGKFIIPYIHSINKWKSNLQNPSYLEETPSKPRHFLVVRTPPTSTCLHLEKATKLQHFLGKYVKENPNQKQWVVQTTSLTSTPSVSCIIMTPQHLMKCLMTSRWSNLHHLLLYEGHRLLIIRMPRLS